MNAEFWNGKRVLVTGHTGFKGSWLCTWLKAMGAEVTGYALDPPTEPSLFEQASVGRDLEDIRGDLADAARLREAMSRARPEVVFHLAAQSLVRASYRLPVETFETNALGTARLLEAVRGQGGVRSVVVVTTDKCYRNREWHWAYRENDDLGGHDPYAASKACAELIVASYRDAFFAVQEEASATRVASARAGNVIGGGDWAEDRLLPDLVRSRLAEEALQVRAPRAIRPWQHVLEPLAGYLLLAQRLFGEAGADFARAWNFGPEERDARPVEWIANRFFELWPCSEGWRRDSGEHPHEATYLKLDSSLARDRLGWQPCLPLDEALSWVVEWHRAQSAGEDVLALMLAQIERYQRSAGSST